MRTTRAIASLEAQQASRKFGGICLRTLKTEITVGHSVQTKKNVVCACVCCASFVACNNGKRSCGFASSLLASWAELSANFPRAFRELSANCPRIGRERSANFPRNFRERSANFPRTLRELSANFPRTFRELPASCLGISRH